MEPVLPSAPPARLDSLADVVAHRVLLGHECSKMAEVIEVGAALFAPDDPVRRRQLAENLLQLERECPTYLGKGLAAPHTVVDGAPTAAALVTVAHPLDCDTPDGAPIGAAIVLISGAGGRDHLETLARIARIASRNAARELRRAKTARDALAIIRRLESE